MSTRRKTTLEFVRRHFRALEAVGILLVLCSWLYNWWSTERSTEASIALRDSYERVERAVSTVQTMNVIRFEGALSRETMGRSGGSYPSYREMMEMAWHSGEVRQQRVVMGGLKVVGLEVFLSDISPLISAHAATFNAKLISLKSQVQELRDRLHKIMPAEKDTPLTRASIPSEREFTLQAAEDLDVSMAAAVTAALELKEEIQAHLAEQKHSRVLMAGTFFILGSILITLSKLLNWVVDSRRDAKAVAQTATEGSDQMPTRSR